MDSKSIDNGTQQGVSAQVHWPHRVDWRTGKITLHRVMLSSGGYCKSGNKNPQLQ